MSSEITQGTPEAGALQDEIQSELISRGYSTEGDSVMAEFVFVMLCNQKSPDQITSELQDLIGDDFESSFTSWLFKAVTHRYPNSKAAQQYGPAKPQPSSSAPAQSAGVNPLPARPSPFGNVAAGIKRSHESQTGSGSHGGRSGSAGPPSQRQRTAEGGPFPDNAPRGPRNPQPTDGDPSYAPTRREKPLSERMGPPPGSMPMMTPMGPAFVNPQTGEAVPAPPELFMNGGNEMQQQGGRGQRGGRGRGGRGGGRDKDGNRRNDKQQQQPMMFPQGMPMFFAPGPNGQPQPFFPQASNQPGSPSFFPFQQAGGMPGFPQAQQQQQQQASLPSKPSQEGLCKYATECKNAYCKFSHPSPAATKESGLTLSSEPCDRQLQCEDADCEKSHVSPQQKDPANSRPAPGSEQVGQPFAQMAMHQQQPFAQQAVRPCKFGGSCTRAGCAFLHPWNNPTPCRFGAGCTRQDCYFMHPPGRKVGGGGGSGRGGYANKGHRTAVFNQSDNATSVEEKLKETEAEKHALSERMKRFAQSGETEKIIPGQQQQEQVQGAAADKAPMTTDAAAKTAS